MPIIGLVPARGNSKGISKKNLAIVGGKSLLAITASNALQSKRLDSCYLSTDCQEIAEAGSVLGLKVPFLRPKEFSSDEAPMIDVLQHFLSWYYSREGKEPEAIVLLQPTSPFRTSAHIDAAIELWQNTKADTVVSVVQIPHHFHPDSAQKLSEDMILTPLNPAAKAQLRRQDKPPVFARNGPALLILSNSIIKTGHLYGGKTVGFVMDADVSLDIDSPLDLAQANFLWNYQQSSSIRE